MLNRRHFIAGAVASTAAFAGAARAEDLCAKPAKWDESFDVVVIGAGGAGLSAAIVARGAGAKTLLLEKMAFAGGNTLIAGGGMNAAVKADYEKAGIKDSPKLHAEQTLAAGDYRADPALVEVLTKGAPESVAWLKKLGVNFRDHIYQIYGGLYPRCRNPIEPKGEGYVKALAEEAKRVGVDLRTGAKVTRFFRESPLEGRLTGVEVEIKGKKLAIEAKSGVVSAAGGFSANASMCGLHDPRLEKLGTTNQPGATGEVLVAMVDIGADTTGLDYIQCVPGMPKDVKSQPSLISHVDRFLFINHEGKRFVAEDSRRDILRDAVLAQTKMEAFTLVDRAGFAMDKNSTEAQHEAARKAGALYVGNTVEEIARAMGVPADALQATLDDYNKAVETKKDPFGRHEDMLVHTVAEPPFYAVRIVMARHHTMGGVRIDTKARVVDRRGNVIPGLYAAGEVTGGIHGTNRVGGNALADVFTFGRIAGESAAKKL